MGETIPKLFSVFFFNILKSDLRIPFVFFKVLFRLPLIGGPKMQLRVEAVFRYHISSNEQP